MHTREQNSVTTADSDNTSVRKAIIGSCIGVGLLVLLLVLAIFNANSVLGWILAGLILGWLALAVYLVRIVLVSIKQDRAELSRIHREESDAMLADKLAHSFQIVLVQSREIANYLTDDSEESRAMIERALDTINTTASKGMGMVNDEMRGEE